MNIYRLLVIEVVVTKNGKKSCFNILLNHFLPEGDGVIGLVVTLSEVWRWTVPRIFSAWHQYEPESATERFFKFRTTFHFSHDTLLGGGGVSRRLSNKVWFIKVPRLVSSGTKLLLKYQKNFVLIFLERTMARICKSVPAYSGFFCSQIDRIWGRLRICSMKKDKTE